MKDFLVYLGGGIGCLNLLWVAWGTWRGKVNTTNTATWMMWFVLDVIILGSNIATGKPYLLALGFTIGAAPNLLLHLKRGAWKWTGVETFSACGASIATVLWLVWGGEAGVVAGALAMNFASLPVLRDLWRCPDRTVFPLFAFTAVAGFITLLGTWPWTIGGSFFAGSSTIANTALALVVLRARPRSSDEMTEQYN